jgi:hypothetical protein
MDTKVGLTLRGVLAPRRGAADAPGVVDAPAAALDAPVDEPMPYRAPARPPDLPNGDDQAYAAAELVRLGFARRVTLVNATLDDALPEAWEIRGTPVGLVRLPFSRSRLTAGPR